MATNVLNLRAADDAQTTSEGAFRESLGSLPAGDDGVPVISAVQPAYANELGDGRITLVD